MLISIYLYSAVGAVLLADYRPVYGCGQRAALFPGGGTVPGGAGKKLRDVRWKDLSGAVQSLPGQDLPGDGPGCGYILPGDERPAGGTAGSRHSGSV